MKSEPQNQLKERLGPVAWVDMENNLHFDVVELLELFGWEDTPANREEVMTAIDQIIKEKFPNMPIKHRLIPD